MPDIPLDPFRVPNHPQAPRPANFDWNFDGAAELQRILNRQRAREAQRGLEEMERRGKVKKEEPPKIDGIKCTRCMNIIPAAFWQSAPVDVMDLNGAVVKKTEYVFCEPCCNAYRTCMHCRSLIPLESFQGPKVPANKQCHDCGPGGKQPLSVKQMEKWTPKSSIIKARKDKVWKVSTSEPIQRPYFG